MPHLRVTARCGTLFLWETRFGAPLEIEVSKKSRKQQSAPQAKTAEQASPNGAKPHGLTEAQVLERYPQAVRGTFRLETAGRLATKHSVEIRCAESGCTTRRRVATSDLFQVERCEPHTKAARATARAARAKKTRKAPAAA